MKFLSKTGRFSVKAGVVGFFPIRLYAFCAFLGCPHVELFSFTDVVVTAVQPFRTRFARDQR